jgi:hypothetical protein
VPLTAPGQAIVDSGPGVGKSLIVLKFCRYFIQNERVLHCFQRLMSLSRGVLNVQVEAIEM